MDNENKVGKLIAEIRKEKGLTQHELADRLLVSDKTVSKWECGLGLPDTTLLNKISEELGITTDELLQGKRKKRPSKRIFIILLLIIILILGIGIVIRNKNLKKEPVEPEEKPDYPCTMVANYFIHLIFNSQDEKYKYITITRFQDESIYSVKIPKVIAEKLQKEKRYKFTFKTKTDYQDVTADELFLNSEIIDVTESGEDELGSKYTCP